MLHLQPGVHFHEIEFVCLRVENELNSTSIIVTHCLRCFDSCIANACSQLLINGRWRFLNDLLVPALHRAITLIQMHIVAMLVAKDLNLNMTRSLHVLLHKHVIISKALNTFPLGSFQLPEEVFLLHDDSHTLSSATKRRLQHHREADLLGFSEQVVG